MIKNYRVKKTVTLSPKGASKLYENETTDNRGNKFIFTIDLKPHPISTPTIEGSMKYND